MASDQPPKRVGVELPLVYSGAADADVLLANHFSLQQNPLDDFLLTVGQLAPPPLLGSPDDQVEQARKLGAVPIRVLGRFSFSRHRAEELLQLLQRQIAAYDSARGLDR